MDVALDTKMLSSDFRITTHPSMWPQWLLLRAFLPSDFARGFVGTNLLKVPLFSGLASASSVWPDELNRLVFETVLQQAAIEESATANAEMFLAEARQPPPIWS